MASIDSKINYLIEVLELKRKTLHDQAKLELERKEKMIKDQMIEGGMLISQTTSMLNLAVELIKENNGTQFSMVCVCICVCVSWIPPERVCMCVFLENILSLIYFLKCFY